MEVPCGKCPECLERRRADWSLRLSYESRRHINSQFITLTYEDDFIVYGARSPTLVKADLQLFFKRLRKRLINSKLKYYAIGEYGTNTHRPHYHIILFGLDHSYVHRGILEKCWSKGFVKVGTVNRSSIHYCTKYHANRTDYPDGSVPPFALISKGLGLNYVDDRKDWHDGNLDKCYVQDGSFKKSIPRYWREKLYSKEELEHINSNNLIRLENEKEKFMDDYHRNNTGSYYDYLEQVKERKFREYKQKINKSNKF